MVKRYKIIYACLANLRTCALAIHHGRKTLIPVSEWSDVLLKTIAHELLMLKIDVVVFHFEGSSSPTTLVEVLKLNIFQTLGIEVFIDPLVSKYILINVQQLATVLELTTAQLSRVINEGDWLYDVFSYLSPPQKSVVGRQSPNNGKYHCLYYKKDIDNYTLFVNTSQNISTYRFIDPSAKLRIFDCDVQQLVRHRNLFARFAMCLHSLQTNLFPNTERGDEYKYLPAILQNMIYSTPSIMASFFLYIGIYIRQSPTPQSDGEFMYYVNDVKFTKTVLNKSSCDYSDVCLVMTGIENLYFLYKSLPVGYGDETVNSITILDQQFPAEENREDCLWLFKTPPKNVPILSYSSSLEKYRRLLLK
jgi:hypothetical protein